MGVVDEEGLIEVMLNAPVLSIACTIIRPANRATHDKAKAELAAIPAL
jgi:hypothetical protein